VVFGRFNCPYGLWLEDSGSVARGGSGKSSCRTLQVDGLARITGLSGSYSRLILSHRTASPHALYDVSVFDERRVKTNLYVNLKTHSSISTVTSLPRNSLLFKGLLVIKIVFAQSSCSGSESRTTRLFSCCRALPAATADLPWIPLTRISLLWLCVVIVSRAGFHSWLSRTRHYFESATTHISTAHDCAMSKAKHQQPEQ